MGRSFGIAAGLLAGLLAGLAGGPMAAPALAGECGALANLRIEAVNLHSAAEVPASGDLPAYCRVLGTVRPAIGFEVRLPLRDWNGKYTAPAAAASAARSCRTPPASPTR